MGKGLVGSFQVVRIVVKKNIKDVKILVSQAAKGINAEDVNTMLSAETVKTLAKIAKRLVKEHLKAARPLVKNPAKQVHKPIWRHLHLLQLQSLQPLRAATPYLFSGEHQQTAI